MKLVSIRLKPTVWLLATLSLMLLNALGLRGQAADRGAHGAEQGHRLLLQLREQEQQNRASRHAPNSAIRSSGRPAVATARQYQPGISCRLTAGSCRGAARTAVARAGPVLAQALPEGIRMPASSPVTAGPPAQTAAPPPAGAANARASGRSAAPAFMERLAVALGQPAGASQDAGLAVQTPAATTVAQPTDGTQAGADAATPPAIADALAILSAAPPTPTGAEPASVGKPGAGGPEPAAPPARAPGKPANGAARGARSADTGSSPGKDAAGAVLAAPAAQAPPASAAPQPTATIPFTPPGDMSGTPRPAHAATDDDTPAAGARRDVGARPVDGRAAQAEPRDQASVASKAEASVAAIDAAPAQGSAQAAIDAEKAAPGVAHDTLSGDAVISALTEAAPPARPHTVAGPAATEPARGDIASPAQQLAAPLVALGSGPDQSRSMTVRLDPEALGAVQVRIDRPKDGPARIEVTVERPETLSLLLRDQPQLQRALDQAGIPQDGRSLTFQIATPDPQARNDTAFLDHRQSGSGQPLAGDGGSDRGSGSGESGSGQSRRGGADEDGPAFRFTPSATLRRLRDGLDITA